MLGGSRTSSLRFAAFLSLAAAVTLLLSLAVDAQTLFRHCLEYPDEYLGPEADLLDGAEISRRWYVVNPEEGVFDWSEVDQQMSYLSDLGLLSSLRIYTACPPKWRLWDEESVTPHWVYAAGADKCGARTAYMRLGDANDPNDQANGNGVPDIDQKQVTEDGMTVFAVKAASKCRGTNRAAGHEHIYFDLDDDIFSDVRYPLTVTISYLDDGGDTVGLEYDSRTHADVVQNSSMEEAAEGKPAGWYLWADERNQTTLIQATQFARSGSHSALILCFAGQPDAWSSMSQSGRHLAVQEGVSYRLSAWIRAAEPVNLIIKVATCEGGVIASRELSVGPDLSWHQLEFTCQESSKDNIISFAFPGENDIWIDDVMLVAMGGEDPYRSAGVVTRSGSGAWKTAQWHLCDAAFRNRQKSGCDLRIRCGDNSDVYVRYIDVHADKTFVEPAYWDPVYQRCYGEFIDALGARYNTAGDLAYVIASFGLWGEISVIINQCHVRQGYTLEGYLEYVSFVAQRYRAAFPDKLLSAPVGGIYDQDGWHNTEAMEEIPAYLASLGYMIDYTGGDGDPASGNWYDDFGRSVPGTISYLYVAYEGQVPTCSESTGWQMHTNPEDVWRWMMHMLSLRADHVRAYKQELTLNEWAFQFAKMYLGKTVETTDGVWIGLRQGDRGNYDFFLTQDDTAPGGQTRVTDGHRKSTWIGAKECRYTDLAASNDCIYFNIDEEFECGGSENPVTLSVTYFDAGHSDFVIEYDSAGGDPYKTAATVQLEGTDSWRTAECQISDAAFANGQYGNDFRIRAAGADDVYVHFVWLRRLGGIGGPPSDPPPGQSTGDPEGPRSDPAPEPASGLDPSSAAATRPEHPALPESTPAAPDAEEAVLDQGITQPPGVEGGLGQQAVLLGSLGAPQTESQARGRDTLAGGKECWSTRIAQGIDCIYFAVDSGFDGEIPRRALTVAYFDLGYSEFAVEYEDTDSGEYETAATVRLSGSNTWKTANCEIPGPALAEGHIRIRALGSDDVYVRFVIARTAD